MTGLPIFLRPSAKFQEIDLTQRISVILSTIFSVAGEFERGPLDPTYLDGTPEAFANTYGRIANVAKYGFAHDTVMAAMTQTSNGLIKRVVNSALYAGTSIINDVDRGRWVAAPFPVGIEGSYEDEGISPLVLLSFAGDLITANSFTMDITDGVTVTATTPVVYATSHDATMTNIAAAIQTTVNSFGAGGVVSVYNETSSSSAKDYLILIRTPRDMSLTFSTPALTLGATQAEVNLYEEGSLFDVLAENPGAWANNYGIRVGSVDPGTRERHRITLAGALVESNSFSMDINGVTIGPVVYDTSSDDTLAAIAAAIAAEASVFSATVDEQAGPNDNDRSILIIAQKPGPGALTLTNALVTLGATQVIVITSKVLTGIVPNNTFNIEVVNRENVTLAEENFTVSLVSQINPLGGQQNIEQVINKSSSRSSNFRIIQSSDSYTASMYDSVTGLAPTLPTNINWLAGGDDGVKPTSADIRTGWNTMDDRVTYPFSVMLNAGYTQNSVQKEMTAIAEKRSDCIAILDAPADKQKAQVLREYRLNELDIDSSYAAMYTPDVLIEDINTGERRYIPPSGPMAATYAYSDRITNYMGAPAGLNRGKVPLALGLRVKYKPADEELLFPIGINCIIDKRGIGPTVMGEETLQFKKTILSSVHARRILNIIKTGLVDGLEYTLFDPNTEFTRNQALQIGATILKPIKKGGGLYEYRQVCDTRNNTADVIDNDAIAYDVYLKIIRVVKGILIRGILTRTGASFEEIMVDFNDVG